MYPTDPKVMADDSKPERVHWLVWAIVGAGVLAIVFFAVVPGVKMKMRDSAFLKLRPGDAEARAVELMGPPDAQPAAAADLSRWWGDEVNITTRPQDISRVAAWRSWFPTGSVTWLVGFDNQSRAVAKHRYD